MKLKTRPGDFRVRELLRPDVLGEKGEHRVYRVTKRKLTSPEAARELARAAGVEVGDVSMAGLKDRQGITIQHMSIPGGAQVAIEDPELRIDYVGRSEDPISSEHSDGNAFEICVRDLDRSQLEYLRRNLEVVRRYGVPNYFDEQRFGNLAFNQGWVARELMLGRAEQALRQLLVGEGEYEREESLRFKRGLTERWGNFEACRDLAQKAGQHRSIFEHLVDHPGDFRGAFRYVASRVRLIHLYAYQSHLWNRAVTERLRGGLSVERRLVVDSVEGPLVCHGEELPEGVSLEDTFRLPAAGLEDVADKTQRDLLSDVLASEGLAEGQFEVQGVEGFALKGEDRPMFCVPRHLRVRPAEEDREYRGSHMVKLRFELPRGAYATLVVRRLLAQPVGTGSDEATEPQGSDRGEYSGPRGPQRRPGERGAGGPRGGARGFSEGEGRRHHGGPHEAYAGGQSSYGGGGGGSSRGRDHGGSRSYGSHREGGGSYRGGRGQEGSFRGGRGQEDSYRGARGQQGSYRGGGRDDAYRGGRGQTDSYRGGHGQDGPYRGGRDQGGGYRGGPGQDRPFHGGRDQSSYRR